MEHHLRKIHNKKLFFLKSFIVSVILLIIVHVIGVVGFDFFSGLVDKYYSVDPDDYAQILVLSCCIWKLFIIQFTLVPTIAFAMLEKHIRKEENID